MGLDKNETLANGFVASYHAPAVLNIQKEFKADGEDFTFNVRTSYASFKDKTTRDAGGDSVPCGMDVTQEITQDQFDSLLTLLDTFAKAKLTGSPLAGATDNI